MKLYKLKSNKSTIVKIVGNKGEYQTTSVVWSRPMEFGYSSTWMTSRLIESNLIELNDEETDVIINKMDKFARDAARFNRS